MTQTKNYLSTKEAADIIGVSADHVRALITQGKIAAHKIGPIWMIRPNAIKHIKRQRKPTNERSDK